MWWVLAGMFISAMVIIGQLNKRSKAKAFTGATWVQQHVAIVGIFAVVVPIAVGVILVNTVYGNTTETRQLKKANQKVLVHDTMGPPPKKPQPILKLIISDGSQEATIPVLNRCASDEVTVIQNGVVQCANEQSPAVRAWVADIRMQEKHLLDKFISHQVKYKFYTKVKNKVTIKKNKKHPKVMQQGFLWQPIPTKKPAQGTTTVTKKKPFKDRHAELFYFLALVLGVLGKYFWDYYEDKRVGKEVSFHPHLIIMSFIIAGLVYYSIQQGIEKEADKLTTRGIVFAFNNGFMWQTILTSLNRSKNGQPVTAEEKPAA